MTKVYHTLEETIATSEIRYVFSKQPFQNKIYPLHSSNVSQRQRVSFVSTHFSFSCQWIHPPHTALKTSSRFASLFLILFFFTPSEPLSLSPFTCRDLSVPLVGKLLFNENSPVPNTSIIMVYVMIRATVEGYAFPNVHVCFLLKNVGLNLEGGSIWAQSVIFFSFFFGVDF